MVKRGISPEINALSTLMIAAEIALVLLADFFRSGRREPAEKKNCPMTGTKRLPFPLLITAPKYSLIVLDRSSHGYQFPFI